MQVLATTIRKKVARWTFLFRSMRAYWRHQWRCLFSGCVNQAMQMLWGMSKAWTERLCCLHVHWLADSLQHHSLSPPGSSVHRIFQARILDQVAISSSRGSYFPPHQGSNPRLLHLLHCRQMLYHWATLVVAKRLCPLWKIDGGLANPNSTKQWDIAMSTRHVIV